MNFQLSEAAFKDKTLQQDAIRKHREQLIRYFRNHRVSIWDAEELSHEVFYKVLHCNVENELIYNPYYLFRVARNILCDYAQRNKQNKTMDCRTIDLDTPEPADEIAPDLQVEGLRLAEKLQNCLQSMPGARRAVMQKYLFRDITQKQISLEQSVSLGAIEVHIKKGRQQLAEAC